MNCDKATECKMPVFPDASSLLTFQLYFIYYYFMVMRILCIFVYVCVVALHIFANNKRALAAIRVYYLRNVEN